MATGRKICKSHKDYCTTESYRLVDVQYEGLTNGVAGELWVGVVAAPGGVVTSQVGWEGEVLRQLHIAAPHCIHSSQRQYVVNRKCKLHTSVMKGTCSKQGHGVQDTRTVHQRTNHCPVFGIRDILVRVRMRILGSVPLTIGSGCGSVPKSSVTFGMQKK